MDINVVFEDNGVKTEKAEEIEEVPTELDPEDSGEVFGFGRGDLKNEFMDLLEDDDYDDFDLDIHRLHRIDLSQIRRINEPELKETEVNVEVTTGEIVEEEKREMNIKETDKQDIFEKVSEKFTDEVKPKKSSESKPEVLEEVKHEMQLKIGSEVAVKHTSKFTQKDKMEDNVMEIKTEKERVEREESEEITETSLEGTIITNDIPLVEQLVETNEDGLRVTKIKKKGHLEPSITVDSSMELDETQKQYKEELDESFTDKPLSLTQTIPLQPSLTLDEMSPKPSFMECLAEKTQLSIFFPTSFPDTTQPPDVIDHSNEVDVIEPSQEIICPPFKASRYPEEGEHEDEPPQTLSKIPLSLLKCFGHEKTLPVLSMSQGQELFILYACSNCGVFYNVENKQQYLLQGHRNGISCLAASYDKKMAIVGDKGADSIVNVWQILLESKQMRPVKTFFNFQKHGVSAVAMSNTGSYLAIISADPVQTLTIWNWTDPSDTPIVELSINPEYGYQKDIIFNSEDSSQLASNSESQVVFYAWNENMIKLYAHQLNNFDLNKVGKFTTTVFFKNVNSALSATSLGKFVVWEKYKSHLLDGLTPFKKVQKIVRMQSKPITVLTTVNRMIVTGDALGQIKFYDETLKLVNLFQDVSLGSITSISFDFSPDNLIQDDAVMLQTAMRGNVFTTPNFIFGTSMAQFVRVTANGTKYDIVCDEFDCSVVAMDIHPHKPLIAIGGQNGFLKLVHYKNVGSVASKLFENGKAGVTCLKYNSDGSMLAVGLSNGKISVFHGLNLRPFCKTVLNDTTEAITHITFSHNMQYMATADSGHAVTLYSIVKDKIWIDENQNFKFVGRYKAHNKQIRSLLFRTNSEDNSTKIFSLSLDRHLAEYEIVKGLNGLKLKSRDRVEQFGLPLCMTSYPRLSRDDFIMVCNDQFKFKLLNSLSRICRKTLKGPTYGSPVEKFTVSSAKVGNEPAPTYFIACMLGDKIAISLLPITGNQHRSFGLISHPTGVKNIVVSSDGKYLFSVGGASASLMMWSINLAALEVQERLGGSDLAPFYEQINVGKNSRFMYHLENLFYFAQIRNQGIHTRDKRKVGVEVPLAEIPSIMRALGYYPTEEEIFTMINEIRYEKFAETGETVNSIDVGQFLKLYINHRPVMCTQLNQIESAFETLGKLTLDGTYVIEEEELVNQLLNYGEPMTESELADCLATFTGVIRKADLCTKQQAQVTPGILFPAKLNAEQFQKLLGFKKEE